MPTCGGRRRFRTQWRAERPRRSLSTRCIRRRNWLYSSRRCRRNGLARGPARADPRARGSRPSIQRVGPRAACSGWRSCAWLATLLPTHSHRLGERRAQYRAATLDGGLPHAGLAHPRVPALDVGHAEPGHVDRRDRVGLHLDDAALVVASGGLGPDRVVDLAPRGEHVGDLPTTRVRRGRASSAAPDPLGLPLGPPDRSC